MVDSQRRETAPHWDRSSATPGPPCEILYHYVDRSGLLSGGWHVVTVAQEGCGPVGLRNVLQSVVGAMPLRRIFCILFRTPGEVRMRDAYCVPLTQTSRQIGEAR